MKRQIAFICALIIICCFMLPSCSSSGVNSIITDKYINCVESMNFEEAHSCFWKHADYVKKETYVEDCEYIVNKLGVTDIKIENEKIEQKDTSYVFSYDITLFTKEAGEITSHAQTKLINQKGETLISYSSELLLEDFKHGDVITRVTLAGKRGEIFTADGKPVAKNSYADTVYMTVDENTDFKSVITQVDSVLDLSSDELSKIKKDYDSAVENGYGTVKIKVFSQGSLDEETLNKLKDVDGIGVDSKSMTYQRLYPEKNAYCHLLGYANSPNEEQAQIISDGGYSSSSVFGKEGVEKAYNDVMLAKDGYAYQLRSDNYEIKKVLFESPEENGSDVILTVNSLLQEKSYELMETSLDEEQAGSVIILNGKTGAVEAQANYPGFDPNDFTFGISKEEYDALLDDERTPLFNRATQGLYPPGSTIKPFTAVAAFNENIANSQTVFPYAVSNNKWAPENWHWLPITRNEYVAAPETLYDAMVHSDNIYFAWLGLTMGYDKLADYFSSLGIGEKLPYDLPTSKSNLINEDAEHNGTMTADMSFGHGQILVTPLQVASMYTAFLNDGDILTPYVIDKLGSGQTDNYTTEQKGERSVFKQSAVNKSYLSALNAMFEDVVKKGTAAYLNGTGQRVLAKTGTAIKGNDKDKRISWIVAWTPDSEDSRIVLVVIETPKDKGNVKLSIAKALLTAANENEL